MAQTSPPSHQDESSVTSSRGPRGRAFYESIGSPKMIVAPMVDRSEFAWRMLTRSYINAEASTPLLAYSPMLHARLFTSTPKFREAHFQPTREGLVSTKTTPSQNPWLDGNPSIDRPLFVQFCANKPDELLEAARYVEPYCDAVDLNLGCPQGIAKNGHYGAFLQEDWELIYELINKLDRELSIPVTAKMRILETKERTLDYAKMILSAGASIITVHGRRREQKGHNMGVADWSAIRYLRDNLPPEAVIFANGNILNRNDIQPCLEATGADGIMSAEGNLSDPTIFAKVPQPCAEGRDYWHGRNGDEGYRIDGVIRRYFDIVYQYVLEEPRPERSPLYLPSDTPTAKDQDHASAQQIEDGERPRKKQKRLQASKASSPSLKAMQGHLFQLLRPMLSTHTNIRDALARCRVGDISAFENVLRMVEEAVKISLQHYENDRKISEEGHLSTEPECNGSIDDNHPSSKRTIAKYKRPWWICQPYIRPLPEEAMEKGALQMSKKDKAKGERISENVAIARDDEPRDRTIPNASPELPRPALVCG